MFQEPLILKFSFIIRIELNLFVNSLTLNCIYYDDARYSENVCTLTFIFDVVY